MRTERGGGGFKDFLILLASAFLIYTFNIVFMVVTPLLLTDLGGSEALAGLQGTLFLGMAILLRFFCGPLADTYGRRMVMVLGSGAFFIGAVLLMHAVEIWQVVALRLVQAFGLAAYFPAASATAAACAGEERKGTYIGVLRMVSSLSMMVGPAFGIMLIQRYSYDGFLKSMAVFALLGMGALFFISTNLIEPQKNISQKDIQYKKNRSFGTWFQVLSILRKSPLTIALTFAAALSYGIYMTFAVPFVIIHTTIANGGFFFTLFSLGGLMANGVFSWFSDRLGHFRLTVSAFLAMGSGMILFALLPYVSLFVYPAALLGGVGYYGCIAVLMAWFAEEVDQDKHTTAFSLQQNALDFGIAAGSGVFGILLRVIGNTSILYGALGVLYLFLGWFQAGKKTRKIHIT
ncbi:MFS transporter [Desulfitobacterium sp. PCE1]|uniref:MFS transporter n=1 Tax=Desulfitobacterium sp. PCE1 TaxID=146907 RepID=UPI00037927CD|nr:MFS transporter [Desulfitobacterium sp. PCE1]